MTHFAGRIGALVAASMRCSVHASRKFNAIVLIGTASPEERSACVDPAANDGSAFRSSHTAQCAESMACSTAHRLLGETPDQSMAPDPASHAKFKTAA